MRVGFGKDADRTAGTGAPSACPVMLWVLFLPVTVAVSASVGQYARGTVKVCGVT